MIRYALATLMGCLIVNVAMVAHVHGWQEKEKSAKEPSPLIGKQVMTTKWNAEFKLEKKVVDQVDMGRVFEVDNVSGGWLHVLGKSGWISAADVVPLEKAELHFNIELRKSEEASAYHHRGLAYNGLEEFDKAIKDFDEAIKRSPKEAAYYNSRGFAYHRKGDYEKALADYTKAIELDAKNAGFINNRGILYRDMGQYEKAVADYDAAIKLAPYFPEAYNARSWLRSTCPDEKFIDAKQALEDAKRACNFTNWRDDVPLGTLSAAYARTGDFEQAKKWLTSAKSIHPNRLQEKRAEMMKQFGESKPYVENPKS